MKSALYVNKAGRNLRLYLTAKEAQDFKSAVGPGPYTVIGVKGKDVMVGKAPNGGVTLGPANLKGHAKMLSMTVSPQDLKALGGPHGIASAQAAFSDEMTVTVTGGNPPIKRARAGSGQQKATAKFKGAKQEKAFERIRRLMDALNDLAGQYEVQLSVSPAGKVEAKVTVTKMVRI